jgi:hypothetical protein
MTIAAAGEVWQVNVQGFIENQECENVLFFRSQALDPNMENNIFQDIIECIVQGLVPKLSKEYRFSQLSAFRVTPTVGPVVEVFAGVGISTDGDASGDSLPSFVSALISLHTTRGGRSGRGRMFIPGVAEGDTVASSINVNGPLWAALVAFVACMIGKFLTKDVPVGGNWEWGVMSRKIGGRKPPFLAAGFAPITRAVPKRMLATTRSRKVR